LCRACIYLLSALSYVLIRISGIRMKKLTITIEDNVYQGLYATIGKGNISRFINDIVRVHVIPEDIAAGYHAMAADTHREHDAGIWADISLQDNAGNTAQ
jgi:hypothetical protein